MYTYIKFCNGVSKKYKKKLSIMEIVTTFGGINNTYYFIRIGLELLIKNN